MPPSDYYSLNYQSARHRFRVAAATLNAQQERHSILVDTCPKEDLSTDVAWIGSDTPDWTVVVSSGLHGVEGFFGSAVQLAWLSHCAAANHFPDNGRIVFIHAINPYGFRFIRRVNEDNTDLNRNFVLPDQSYQGCPEVYEKLHGIFNPEAPAYLLSTFWLKSIWLITRYGIPALKAAILAGQYDYPKGVFFGGKEPALSSCIVQANYKRWIGGASKVIHLDLHTGLGKFGTHKLLMDGCPDESQLNWCQQQFGQERVEVIQDEQGTAYRLNGAMGQWLHHHLSGVDYTHFIAEFGTYMGVRTLGALCADNRAHLYGQPGSLAYERVKMRLRECFCPSSTKWRVSCLEDGLDLVDRCIQAADGTDLRQEIA